MIVVIGKRSTGKTYLIDHLKRLEPHLVAVDDLGTDIVSTQLADIVSTQLAIFVQNRPFVLVP